MKFKDIKNLDIVELVQKIKKEKEDLFNNKMKHSLGQLENPLVIRKIRKSIAKLKTAITAKK
ncbi:MAG: 50S ribosomal protein L29 [Bdellovibrionaceae bacterium]|nr:50S ribosomal protein L29 [Pseudobdellovibrionaceae bacterium]